MVRTEGFWLSLLELNSGYHWYTIWVVYALVTLV